MILDTQKQIRLIFDLTLPDNAELWDSAAAIAMAGFAMTQVEITETIGPRADPDIEACVAMLIDQFACRSGIETHLVTIHAQPPMTFL